MQKTIKTIMSTLITLVLIASLVQLTVASPSLNGIQNGKPIKVDFVHYKDGSYSLSTEDQISSQKAVCYSLVGAKWTLPIEYTINPTNSQGLLEAFISNRAFNSAETWDNAIRKELFDNTYTIDYSTPTLSVQDFNNVISFDNSSSNEIIAFTSVYFVLEPTPQIIEFDIVLNDNLAFGDSTLTPSVYDLQNTITHELGHAVGLGDIYSLSCSSVTMFGFSSLGDTEKRTLEKADIQGLRKIYGNGKN